MVSELAPDRFAVEVPGPGEYLLYLRFSPYFEIEAGSACVEDAGDGDTRLTVEGDGAQTIEVEAPLRARRPAAEIAGVLVGRECRVPPSGMMGPCRR